MKNINNLRIVFNEAFYVLLSLLITLSIALFILKWEFLSINIAFYLDTTNLNLDSKIIIGTLFTLITFLIYLFKGFIKENEHQSSTYIIFISGLLFNILSSKLLHVYTQITCLLPDTVWTIYPPLVAMPKGTNSLNEHLASMPNLFYPITCLQFIVTILMVLIAFKFGKVKAINI